MLDSMTMWRTCLALLVFGGVAAAAPDFDDIPTARRDAGVSTATRAIDPSGEVMFHFNSDALSSDAVDMVGNVAHWLRAHPSERIVLEGYTDRLGTARYNDDLAQRRADHVRDSLISMGIAPERIIVVVHGQDETASSAERRVAIYATTLPPERGAAYRLGSPPAVPGQEP